MSLKSIIASAVIFAITGCFAPQDAHAGIPIPCTGEKIVKVASLPADSVRDGKHVDLGYKFKGCFSGDFVGFLGDGRGYLQFNDAMLEAVRSSGLPAPGFWSAAWNNKGKFWVEWLWLALIGVGGSAMLINMLNHGSITHPSAAAQPETAVAAQPPGTTNTPSAVAQRMARISMPAAGGGAPSFGRR